MPSLIRTAPFWLAVLAGVAFVLAIGGVVLLGVEASSGGEASSHRNVTGAMEPTLLTGETFTATSFPAGGGAAPAVKRGDLVIHAWPPDPSKHFVKRVVGLPGDTLAMAGGELRVNGRPVREPYAWRAEPGEGTADPEFDWQREHLVRAPGETAGADPAAYRPSRNDWGPIRVPEGAYFVLGDNRDNSLDSRYWGFVSAAQLLGRPRRVYFSRDPASGGIRWSRLGRRLE